VGQKSGTKIAGEHRTVFISDAVGSCLSKERAAPESAGISDGLLVSFCNCKAAEMADTISLEEVHSAANGLTPAVLAKVDAAVEICAKRVLGR
jgi:hypothetical protein